MFAVLLALLMVLSACSSAAPTGPDAARALIDESATAMGGWAALDAVKQWEYKPTLLNGQAVEVATEVSVPFVL